MRVPIFAYHTISEAPQAGIARFAVRPRDLERHLDLVADGGYTALTISDLVAHFDRGEALPPRTIAITFDDGYDDNLTVAAPLLEARRLRATVYVTTGFLPGCPGSDAVIAPGRMIGWDRLGELEAAGMEIGAHSHTHPQLDLLSRAAAGRQIRQSRDLLEVGLGHAVSSFAYPHGYATPWVRDEVRRCGFNSACGVRNAFSHVNDNHWLLARLTVMDTTTAAQVEAWLDGSGAPVAADREYVRTKAWRAARRARRRPLAAIAGRP